MKVAILGGSGYAGGELLRLLLLHKEVSIEAVTSTTHAGEYVYTMHPNLRGFTDLKFTSFDPKKLAESCETIFIATPHGTSKDLMPTLLSEGLRVVDLSADYRLVNSHDYVKWYGWDHPYPKMLKEGVYGLPEINRDKIKDAKFVACPGCMAGATILAIAPLVKASLIELDNIIVDAKIGSSGSGTKPTIMNHHTERYGSIHPYQVTGHRHIAEIEQELSLVSNSKVIVGFTPHTVNIARGILITAHLKPKEVISEKDVWQAYRGMYKDEPFIRFVKSRKGPYKLPDPRNLIGTNFCDIGFELDEHVNRLVVISAIDNIVKGAAGQAIQCFNIMHGYNEKEGLNLIPIH